MIKILLIALTLSVQASTANANSPCRYDSKSIRLAGNEHATISEGHLEPRSIGSYSLRIYAVLNPQFPYDNFITGIISERDGSIERLAAHDIDNDGTEEITVIMRSVGTGSYISADAWKYRDNQLELLVSVEDLAKTADPITALQAVYNSDLRK